MTAATPMRTGSGGRPPGRTRWRAKRALAVAAALLVLLAIGGVILAYRTRGAAPAAAGHKSAAAGHRSAADARRLLVPPRGDLFGAWVKPTAGFSPAAEEAAVTGLEHALGRKLAIDQLYVRWAAPLPLAVARWDLRQGIIPMISWGGAPTNQIAAGTDDALIRARALQLRALGGPVLLRWFWEMDGAYNRATAVSPASFIRAWRHIHDIFASVGASNVRWVWCPTAAGFRTGIAQQFYPGSAYVDWIGADGYDWNPPRPGAGWTSFEQIFSAFYRWGFPTGKPLIVGEFGVLEGTPGAKAAWFAQAGRELRTQLPDIRAVVYFDSGDQKFDWRVTTSPSALAAFRSFGREPYFSARPST
jgi:Glycosyl hydrolase family 26